MITWDIMFDQVMWKGGRSVGHITLTYTLLPRRGIQPQTSEKRCWTTWTRVHLWSRSYVWLWWPPKRGIQGRNRKWLQTFISWVHFSLLQLHNQLYGSKLHDFKLQRQRECDFEEYNLPWNILQLQQEFVQLQRRLIGSGIRLNWGTILLEKHCKSATRYMKILKYTMTGSSREFYGTGTNFFRYRYRYFFPGPNFSGTGTGTFFGDQFFPVPVLVPSKKERNSRDRDVTLYPHIYLL